MLLVLGFVGAILAVAVPNVLKVREDRHRADCIKNLKMISVAKDKWAMDHKAKNGAKVPMDDLAGVYLECPAYGPMCPEGGAYDVNVVGVAPTCSLGKSEKHILAVTP
ncbi:MAG TPA: hypothetical protein VMI31_09130 [Fimbriimonadaceae bacterium]|nr:hypothetical protein [Fimbriimonadaceae bacterium]